MDPRLIELISQLGAQLEQGLPGLAALVVVFALFALAGAALGRDRTLILMIARGWAMTTVSAIVLPLVGIEHLAAIFIPVALLAIAGAFALRKTGIEGYALVPSLVLGLPLVLLGCLVPSTFNDAYSHWLPNAHYLVQLDRLVSAPLPPGFFSLHPTYAPALALPVWLASQMLGEFAIGTAQALTTMLVVVSVPLVARWIRVTHSDLARSAATQHGRPWIEALLAYLAVVLLNPGAHGFHYYPTQHGVQFWSITADPPLAIVALVTLLLLAERLGHEPGATLRRKVDPVTWASIGGLAAAIKPGGEFLIAVIAIAAILVTVVARLELRSAAAACVWLALGASAFAMLWRVYGLIFQPTPDLSIGALGEWRLDLLMPFLRSCAAAVREHLAFYLLIAGALVIGLRALLTRKSRSSSLEWLLAASGVAFVGHVIVLTMAYLSVGFGDWEIRGAYSWQRYAGQLGLAACAATLLLLLSWIRARAASSIGARFAHMGTRLYTSVVPLCVVAAIAYLPAVVSAVGTLRLYGKERQPTHRRAVAALRMLPPNARFAVTGRVWSVVFVRYAQWADLDAARRPWRVTSANLANPTAEELDATRDKVLAWIDDPAIDCVLLLDAGELTPLLGLGTSPDHLHCGDTWQELRLD